MKDTMKEFIERQAKQSWGPRAARLGAVGGGFLLGASGFTDVGWMELPSVMTPATTIGLAVSMLGALYTGKVQPPPPPKT
jgi:hypothetical protein